MSKTASQVALDTITDLFDIGVASKTTMREFEQLCIPSVKEYQAEDIKNIRIREHMSQPVFAKCLNVSAEVLKKWEQGLRKPSGSALKLLNLIDEKGVNIILA
ncbi:MULTISPECIES: helix-turn-helix domain-containing protein [Cysteiniphilum]|uniref:Transcriptional regulator n=1 Tax=Cysteiniphilum litorale TaxID=2056700 RepID=A0A8J2Z5X8_9GAMM|nr:MULTISPECIES: transcriptional regulator [Cysteiniphilum]GGG03952.1 transcriptional regulator [Cysteiniphilum litorale]